MRVFTFRVDERDLIRAKKLGINLGAALRRHLSQLINSPKVLEAAKKEESVWTIKKRT